MITIDEALAFLEKAREEIGGDKVLILSLQYSGLSVGEVQGLAMSIHEQQKCVEVVGFHAAIQEEHED